VVSRYHDRFRSPK